MSVENKVVLDNVFLSARDMQDTKLVDALQQLGYEVKERPPHPLVRAARGIMLKYFHAGATRS